MKLKSREEVRERSLAALEQAINIIGNANRLGKALGISSVIIGQWKMSGKYGVNAKYVLSIETLTNREVKRYDLRCDLYPEADTYFFMIKKTIYNICEKYALINLDGLQKHTIDTHISIMQNVEDHIIKYIDKYLLSPTHISEVLEYSEHCNQFKIYLLKNHSHLLYPNNSTGSRAYHAMYADLCIGLYEYLQKNEET